MTTYVTNREGRQRPARELFYLAVIFTACAVILWGCWTPSPAQAGGSVPEPGEGYIWRFQSPDPLPDWIVVMQEAIALRRSTLADFIAAGKATAQAAIDGAQTDSELAAGHLQLRGYEIIATELRDVPLRADIRSEEVGRLILQRIETGAHGIFSDAEREAIAQAAFDYCRSVIAAEAAAQAAIWSTMATTTIDLPSDLGSPVEVGAPVAFLLDAHTLTITGETDVAAIRFGGDDDAAGQIIYERPTGFYLREVPTIDVPSDLGSPVEVGE